MQETRDRALGREWQPTPVFLPGKSHGHWSLVGYRLWGHKQLDTTEQLTYSLSPQQYIYIYKRIKHHSQFEFGSINTIQLEISFIALVYLL